MSGSTNMKLQDGAGLFDTSPPEHASRPPFGVRLKQTLTAKASALVMPVLRKAAGSYVGGETLGEALGVIHRLGGEGLAATLGFWDKNGECPQAVGDICLDAIRRLSGSDCQVSLKPPVLRYDHALAEVLAAIAAQCGVGLYCDSHGSETAEPSLAFAEALAAKLGGGRLGVTLPGRWARSLRDADWALERGLAVRVVKGQWPDPADPARDIATSFLQVIARLAGRARHVAVATHDFALGREAMTRLRDADTSCELGVLLGMPAKPLIAWAKQNGVRVRVYVPFGPGFVPNAIRILRRNPRLILAVAKERMATAFDFAPSDQG